MVGGPGGAWFRGRLEVGVARVPPGIPGSQLAFLADGSSDLRYRNRNRAEELGAEQQTQFDVRRQVMDSDPFAV